MATIRNLPENYLYERLPASLVDLDERGLIQAVLGGYNDRLDDIRSYAKNLQRVLEPGALPQVGNNVVLCDLVGPKGKVYTRSLDIHDETPTREDDRLTQWVINELQLDGDEVAALSNVRFGVDLLRLVDANVLEYLAATVGAILYTSIGLSDSEQTETQRRLVETWFPRLKIKGTARSFEVLGKLLGFEDIRFTPLYSRLSVRDPSDIGSPSNDPDFSAEPDYIAQQTFSALYNPHDEDNGPFYTWTGTASHGTAATDFYTQVVNAFNPWIETLVLDVQHGTVVHPQAGTYALGSSGTLSEGGPHKKAYVDPAGSTLRFQAIGEGDSFNGLVVHVLDTADPTKKQITIDDRLSAIQYRASYFDLGMTVSFERAEEIFGDQAMRRNEDLADNPTLTSDGTAVSPFRPWFSGSIAVEQQASDWVVESGTITGVHTAREQASGTHRQQNTDDLIKAGAQAVAAFEEVRPATRDPRRASVGYLTTGTIPYAAYDCQDVLATTLPPAFVYAGTFGDHPYGRYSVGITVDNFEFLTISFPSSPGIEYAPFILFPTYQVVPTDIITPSGPFIEAPRLIATAAQSSFTLANGGAPAAISIVRITPPVAGVGGTSLEITTGVLRPAAEVDPDNPDILHFREPFFFTGSYDTGFHDYRFQFTSVGPDAQIVAHWTLLDTGTVRPEPTREEKLAGTVCYQARPEDEINGLTYEVFDDYPWRRDIVAGGELVEIDAYSGTAESGRDLVADTMAVPDQTGAAHFVYGHKSASGRLRTTSEVQDIGDDYTPGQAAIAFKANFRNQSTLTANDTELFVNPHDAANLRTQFSRTDMDVVFEPGWALYHAGLVQGVLVADPVGFYGTHHRDDLMHWLPLNEHPDDDLEVRDAASQTAVSTLTGAVPDDRQFDAEQGPYLHFNTGAALGHFDEASTVTDTYTISFWILLGPQLAPGTGDTLFLRYGPLSFDYRNFDTTYLFYMDAVGAPRQLIGVSGTSFPPSWTHIYARVQPGIVNAFTSVFTVAFDSRPFDDGEGLHLQSGSRTFSIRDLRIWKTFKTDAEIAKIANHIPVPTQALYRPGWFTVANSTDRHGLRVLPSGWLAPEQLPAWLRTPKLAWIKRYSALGRYEGESRYEETGLGGGRALPAAYHLGQQFYNLTAEGETVYSTQHGALPGVNQPWLDLSVPGTYAVLNTGSTSTGTNASFLGSGTSSPWPNPMIETNPFRERIWVKGDDNYVYEVTLRSQGTTTAFSAEKLCRERADAELVLNDVLQVFDSTGSVHGQTAQGTIYQNQLLITAGTIFSFISNAASGEFSVLTNGTTEVKVYHPKDLICAEQPTGALVTLESGGTHLTVSFGSVVQSQFSGTDNTPPLYMYLNARTVEDVPDAHVRWTEKSTPELFGNQQDPPVSALDENGVMEFENNSTLTPGNYRLTVDSGNLGRTDRDFDGFVVEIRVDSTVLQKRLLRGQHGFNIRGKDVFEFEIETGVAGIWLLSFDWTNAFSDTAAGVERRLAIFGYKLERLQTEAYRVDIAPSGNQPLLTQLTTGSYTSTTPGGWLVAVSSWGTPSAYRHESIVYASNDTLTNKLPISDLLTSVTEARREDIVITGDFVLADTGSFAMSGTGSISYFVV